MLVLLVFLSLYEWSRRNPMELVANIWPVVDQDTMIVQRFFIKAYSMNATDDEISTVLTTLARSDFRTAEVMPIPEQCIIHADFGIIKGAIEINDFYQSMNSIIEEALTKLEHSYSDMKYCGCDNEGKPRKPEKLKFPAEPYFVTTVVMEDANGELKVIL